MNAGSLSDSSATSPTSDSTMPATTSHANDECGQPTTTSNRIVASGLKIRVSKGTPRSIPAIANAPDTMTAATAPINQPSVMNGPF